MLRSFEVPVTITIMGSGTGYAGTKVTGKVVAVKYGYVNFAAGADLAITGDTTGAPILDVDDIPEADTFWLPHILPHKHTDGSAFTDAAAEPPRVFGEKIKIVILQGGANGKTGTFTLYVEDDTFAEA